MLGGPTSNMSCWDWGRDSESCRLFYLCPNLGRFLLRNNSFFKSQYFKPCNEFKRLSILVQNPAGTFSARHICSQFFEHYCAREQDVQQVHQKRTQRMLITLLFFGHVSHNHLVISDFFFPSAFSGHVSNATTTRVQRMKALPPSGPLQCVICHHLPFAPVMAFSFHHCQYSEQQEWQE